MAPENIAATPAASPTGWVAPTEAGRAQQLLGTQPHLLAAQLELRWLPNAALLAHATAHLAATQAKGTAADQRPALTAAKKQAIAAMSAPLTELRALLKKKFKDGYEAYYPQFGLVRQGKNWDLPRDHDDLIAALRDQLLPALTQHGLAADPDAGTAVWQPLLAQLGTAHTQALALDTARSAATTVTGPQDEQTTKALRALYHLDQAQFPDTWEGELRAWGWRKTGF